MPRRRLGIISFSPYELLDMMEVQLCQSGIFVDEVRGVFYDFASDTIKFKLSGGQFPLHEEGTKIQHFNTKRVEGMIVIDIPKVEDHPVETHGNDL